jgi:hypothetical protein
MSYTPGERQAIPVPPEVFEKTAGLSYELPFNEAGYEELARILEQAYNQSAKGKGKQRHANNLPFKEQPIMKIGRMSGIGGHVYQIMKKAQEAGNMHKRGEHEAAIAEFYGVIVYAAAAVLLTEESK